MCSALGVTRQGYYAWRRRPPSARDERDLELTRLISEVYEASRRIYGAPKVHMELLRRGVRTSRKRVARLMRDNGWEGTTRGCARRPKGAPRAPAPQANAACFLSIRSDQKYHQELNIPMICFCTSRSRDMASLRT